MMEIKEMTTHTFWKGEFGVKGIVLDKDQTYKVSLSIKGSQIYDYSCSCVDGNSYKGMCAHAKALWEHYQSKSKTGTGRSVSTSQEVRAMIREYTNREVSKIIEENEDCRVRLIPRLLLRGKETRLEFKIGNDRMYLLKDLTGFVRAMETGALIRYGKQLEFYHSIRAFVPEDRALVAFMIELVNIYQEHYRHLQRSSFATMQELRELNLSRGNRDRFFGIMEGRPLEVEDQNGSSFLVQVSAEPVQIDVQIRRYGRDGISVSVDKELYGFSGEEHMYLGSREKLNCLDQNATEALRIFLEQMLEKRNHQVEMQERDIPLFIERVLSRILPYCIVDAQDVDLEAYHPQELKASFSFDSPAPGELTMKPELSYGDYSFVPMEDEKVPRTICRDVPGEFRISQVITRYFKYRDADQQRLVIRNDDAAIYRLLKDGISEFMELGDIYISESASGLRLAAPPKVDVGLSINGSWLELKVDTEGLSQSDLWKILSEYDQKKPYYRLKNGEFLQLDDSGLMTVARMVHGLALSKTQLQNGKIQIPRYRALYLDSVLKDGKGITLYRDNLFKAVVRGMKSVEDSDYEIPQSMRTVLRSYQKTGFRWLKTLDGYGFGGILADEMGLGKTIQVIALLLDEKERNRTPEAAGTDTELGQAPGKPVSLIICPASLVYNWENEIHHFAPDLKVQVVAGNASERENLLQKISGLAYDPETGKYQKYPTQENEKDSIRAEDEANADRPDVLVTSYDLLKRDIELYKPIAFRFQIIDEAQYIKNPATQSARAVKQIQSQTRFALTGTPVENRLSELWSIFDYLMPGFLFSYQKFRQTFEAPIVKDNDPMAVQQLHRFIGPFILRRLKKDVLKDLPEKLETVIYAKADSSQKEIYAANAIRLKEQLESMDSSTLPGERMQILAELTRLRQICCDPSLCYSNYKGESAKLETLIALLESAIEGGHKVLVFSQFTSMLDIIGRRLKKEEIAYHLLTGATPKEERIHMAGVFQTDDVPVFLISLRAGGTGLNLTAADIVIHYDPWWNVAVQNQATDRTHRIGQEKQVTVYQLILKDTIEENIRTLQDQKKELADQIITEGTLSMSSLTKEDLIRILGV
jgi:hypothetical protein